MRTDRQTDRQTDITKLIITFRNFAKAPKTALQVMVQHTELGHSIKVLNGYFQNAFVLTYITCSSK
jgi:hypothetical protein